MRPLILIPAVGPVYVEEAMKLVASMEDHGWDCEPMVLAEEPTHAFGKDVKTGFGRYIPEDHTGQVWLMDADILASGPMPQYDGDGVACVDLGKHTNQHVFLDSYLFIFPDATTAREFSAAWFQAWEDAGRPLSDVLAMQQISKGFLLNTEFFAGNRVSPHHSIRHFNINSFKIQ